LLSVEIPYLASTGCVDKTERRGRPRSSTRSDEDEFDGGSVEILILSLSKDVDFHPHMGGNNGRS
jgi:hypothetical protein